MDLSENLKQLRKCREYTQKLVSDKLVVGYKYYNKLERKVMKPSVEILDRLSKIYGISIDEIVYLNKSVLKKVAANKEKKSGKIVTEKFVPIKSRKKGKTSRSAKARA